MLGTEEIILKASKLYIRAMCMHEGAKPFVIFDPQLKPDASTSLLSDVVCNFVLKEESESVQLVAKSGDVLFTSYEGLYGTKKTMNVQANSGRPLFAIDNGHLFDETEADGGPQLTWGVKLSKANRSGDKMHMVMQTSGCHDNPDMKQLVAGISVPDGCSTLCVNYYNSCLSSLKKILILFGALKLYYCIYSLNLRPISIITPAMMPKEPRTPPTLDIFKSVSIFRLRALCKSHTSKTYIDIMDSQENSTAFVAEVGFDNSIAIKDLWGGVFLTIGSGKLLSVHGADGTSYGQEIQQNNQKFLVPAHGTDQYLEERTMPPSPELPFKVFNFYSSSKSYCVRDASIYLEPNGRTVKFDILQDVSMCSAALLFCRAVTVAVRRYQIAAIDYIPFLREYLYRESQ